MEKKPEYLYSKIQSAERMTRLSDETSLRDKRSFKTATANRSFIPRTLADWNKLPVEIREKSSLLEFKRLLKKHVADTTPIR